MGKKQVNPTNSIIQACKILQRFCGYILIRFKDIQDNCRDAFRDIIYSIREEPIEDESKGAEVEVIKFNDLIQKITYVINPE